MTPEEKNILIELILNQIQSLTPETKAVMIEQIETEEFDEDFFEVLEDIFENEIALLEQDIAAIESDLQKIDAEKEDEKKRILPKLRKVRDEYLAITQKIVDEFEKKTQERERVFETTVEKKIHEEVENSEIDAIRSSLQKPKSEEQ